MTQVVPESRLKLIVTSTAPGFGEIEPDKVTEDPTAIELDEVESVMLVDGRVNVVKVVDVVAVVDV